MTDPRHTGPDLNDRSGGSTWAWIAGIAVVILAAFIVAAFWNGTQRTASMTPPETTGMGVATPMTPPAATTGQGAGQGAGAPAIAPSNMAPNDTAPLKTTPPTTPAPATPTTK